MRLPSEAVVHISTGALTLYWTGDSGSSGAGVTTLAALWWSVEAQPAKPADTSRTATAQRLFMGRATTDPWQKGCGASEWACRGDAACALLGLDEGGVDRLHEGLGADGLGEEVLDGCLVDGAHGDVELWVRGEQDAGHIGGHLARLGEELQAIHSRHAVVGEDEGDLLFLEDLEGFLAVERRQDLHAGQ